MATQDYWSAVEEKGLRRNEITCAWFLVLAAVIILQIITSLASTPDCPAGNKAVVAETGEPGDRTGTGEPSRTGRCRPAGLWASLRPRRP